MTRFDYIVIGGGSGGIASARRAAAYGARVALIESERLGGTCVNVGCVPKKIMFNAASVAESLRDAADYGFAIELATFDWATFRAKRDAYIVKLNAIYARNLAKDSVEVFRGRARLDGPQTVLVDTQRLTASHVLIATGGFPRVPTHPGAELGITSDGFFDLEAQPPRVGIVGGGYIAVELGGVMRALGSEVSLTFRGERPMRHFDHTLGETLEAHMRSAGIVLHPATTLVRAYRHADGGHVLETSAQEHLGPFDCILWALGRVPASRGIGLEGLGLRMDDEGHVVVDEYQQTNIPGLHAVGDVTGHVPLTPVAIAAGRRLADRLFGGQPEAKLDYSSVPSVIFSHPPMGTVGLSEEDAIRHFGQDAVKVYGTRFTNLYFAPTERKPATAMKVVTVGSDERVVGMHVVGLGADEMLQGFAVALRMGLRKADLDNTVAIHPTAAEEFVTLK